MGVLAQLRHEEAKLQRQANAANHRLAKLRAAIRILESGNSGGGSSHGGRRKMSAAARAKISRAAKERWARFRAAKKRASA